MKSINTDIDDLPVELQRANNLVEFIVQVLVVYPTYTTLSRLLSRILSLGGSCRKRCLRWSGVVWGDDPQEGS